MEALQSLKARPFIADLATLDGVQALLNMIQEELPDVIINSAGIGLYGDLVTHSPYELQQMIQINCSAVVAICRDVCDLWMKKGVEGIIVNVSSALSFIPSPGASVYGATKAFITSFSQALDVEMERHKIRILTACPGRVATPFARKASKGKVDTNMPGGMLMSTSEVAKDILRQIDEKKPLQIINWKYRLLLFARKFVPERLAMKKLYNELKSRA